MKWTLEHRSTTPGIRDGDVFVENDRTIGAAQQSDTAFYAPVFWDGKLFCWVSNALHIGDIGGVHSAAGRSASGRETFGRPIAQHQSIHIKLAQMATKIRAAELLVLDAAERKAAGERADLQAGMAKLFATETAEERALDAMRIYGGAGFSQDNPVERLYRDAPLSILGEGSNEIRHLIIARRLLELRA